MAEERLRPTIARSSIFGFKARGARFGVAQLLVVALAVWVFAPEARRFRTAPPVALALPPLVVAFARWRKTPWRNRRTNDGTVAVAFDVSGWNPSEVSESKDYHADWIAAGPPVEASSRASGPASSRPPA